MYEGKIIDTHMHLWDLKNDYPWLQQSDATLERLSGNYDALKKNFLVDNYLIFAKKQNIVKSVHLEAHGFKGDPIRETEWLQQQAKQFGFPQAIVARAELNNPNIESVLEKHAQYSNVKGIRMVLAFDPENKVSMSDRENYYEDPAWLHGFSLLKKHNFSFDLQIYSHQIKDYIPVVKRFADTQIILDHFAWPLDLSENGFKEWREGMKLMAENPNVAVKLSGIGWVFKKMDINRLSAYFYECIDIFGMNRCLFGSNFLPDSLFYSFDELISRYKTILSSYAIDEQVKFFHQNAEKIYRI